MTTMALETGRSERQCTDVMQQARPNLHQHAHEVQPYGHVVKLPIALAENVRKKGVDDLNQFRSNLEKTGVFHLVGSRYDEHLNEQAQLEATFETRYGP